MTFNHVVRGSSPRWFTNAPLAQLVEQMTLNHWVLGSSPRGRTIFLMLSDQFLLVAFFILQAIFGFFLAIDAFFLKHGFRLCFFTCIF